MTLRPRSSCKAARESIRGVPQLTTLERAKSLVRAQYNVVRHCTLGSLWALQKVLTDPGTHRKLRSWRLRAVAACRKAAFRPPEAGHMRSSRASWVRFKLCAVSNAPTKKHSLVGWAVRLPMHDFRG